MRVSLTVNGESLETEVWPGESLLYALRERLGLPVFDMVSFVTWFHGGLSPQRWSAA